MGRQLTDKELKRFGRVLAGHAADKDRARWKRKVKGQAAPATSPRKSGARADEASADELLEEATEDESEP